MLIKVKRFFISAVYGNVDEGRILAVSDFKGEQFINAGLAEEIVTPAVDVASFQAPVEVEAGSSLPVDQASQSQTASASEGGVKKVVYKKGKKSAK
jgi:hypothetical protein